MHERTERLLAIMEKYELKDADVAALIGVNAATVGIWRCKNPARIVPVTSLRLLETELMLRAAKVSA